MQQLQERRPGVAEVGQLTPRPGRRPLRPQGRVSSRPPPRELDDGRAERRGVRQRPAVGVAEVGEAADRQGQHRHSLEQRLQHHERLGLVAVGAREQEHVDGPHERRHLVAGQRAAVVDVRVLRESRAQHRTRRLVGDRSGQVQLGRQARRSHRAERVDDPAESLVEREVAEVPEPQRGRRARDEPRGLVPTGHG
jgi:hypothetical protein